jgi:hypothetical protein
MLLVSREQAAAQPAIAVQLYIRVSSFKLASKVSLLACLLGGFWALTVASIVYDGQLWVEVPPASVPYAHTLVFGVGS